MSFLSACENDQTDGDDFSYYLGIRCTGPAAIWFSNVVSLPHSDIVLADVKELVYPNSSTTEIPPLYDLPRSLIEAKSSHFSTQRFKDINPAV